MFSQRSKDFLFAVVSPPVVINHYIKKWTYRGRNPLRLNLGCGTRNIPGYANIDINPFTKSDLWLDARYGLPFAEQPVEPIYSFHTLKHLFPTDMDHVLAESRQALNLGAAIRVVGP